MLVRQEEIMARPRKFTRQKLVLYILLGLIGITLLGFIGVFGVFAWYARSLPSPDKLSESANASTIFYDRDGKVLYEVYKDKNRVPAKLTEVSKYIQQATIAIEDKDFYRHQGVSERGMIRAALNVLSGAELQSGSTITQQLIKNVLLDSSQTSSRKVKEIILAFEVERRYSKDEILQMYLNEAPYGGTFTGIGSAAKGYFDKSPKEVTILEAAFLAGLPQSPSYYSPFIGSNDAWKGRTKSVLRRMREDGYITKKQEDDSIKQIEKMKFTAPNLAITAPHFVFYTRGLIEKEFGPKVLDTGLKVKTTLSLDVQRAAEKIVKAEVEKLKDAKVGNGAAVVMDSQTGEILAMVGSYDYNNAEYGKFNVAAEGLRQPGSSIKPITFAVALEKGYTPATLFMDVKTPFYSSTGTDYSPVNYDGKFRGPVQMRYALANSLNIPAVKMLAMVGLRDFLRKADDMGLNGFAPTQQNMSRFGLAVTLGGGESTLLDMTSAFSIFARGGIKKDTQSIQEIADYNGKVIFRQKQGKNTRALSPEVSFLISHMLSDNTARAEAFGTNSLLRIPGKTVSVKTGTTDDKRDNWAIGYTKAVTVGVWVGNNDNSPMDSRIASGVTGASPIWNKIMVELLKKYDDGIMEQPSKVKAVEVDKYLGGLPRDGAEKRSEYFIEGTEPKDISPYYKKIKISKANGKLANEVEIRAGNYEEKDFYVVTENDPVSTDGKNRWQEAIDAWAREQGDDKWKPPTENSDTDSENVVVSWRAPNDKTTVSNDVPIEVRIASVASIRSVKLYINGEEKKNFDGDIKSINERMNLPDGTYELKVVARNDKDKTGESSIKIGVNKKWDESNSQQQPTTAPTSAPGITFPITP